MFYPITIKETEKQQQQKKQQRIKPTNQKQKQKHSSLPLNDDKNIDNVELRCTFLGNMIFF